MEKVKVELEMQKQVYDELVRIALKRKTSVNHVIEQSIVNEGYFEDRISEGFDILIDYNGQTYKIDLRR